MARRSAEEGEAGDEGRLEVTGDDKPDQKEEGVKLPGAVQREAQQTLAAIFGPDGGVDLALYKAAGGIEGAVRLLKQATRSPEDPPPPKEEQEEIPVVDFTAPDWPARYAEVKSKLFDAHEQRRRKK
jgi:hypothetical protein